MYLFFYNQLCTEKKEIKIKLYHLSNIILFMAQRLLIFFKFHVHIKLMEA